MYDRVRCKSQDNFDELGSFSADPRSVTKLNTLDYLRKVLLSIHPAQLFLRAETPSEDQLYIIVTTVGATRFTVVLLNGKNTLDIRLRCLGAPNQGVRHREQLADVCYA